MYPQFFPQAVFTVVLLLPQPVQPTLANYSQPDPDQATVTLTALDVRPVQPFKRVDLG